MTTTTAQEQEWFGDHSKIIPMVSLDSALSCPIATEYFLLHCKRELNEENLVALLELKALKQISSADELNERAKAFFQNFLSNESPFEVNIPKKILQDLNDANLTKYLDVIKAELETNLQDPLQRFKESDTMEECIPMCWYNNKQFATKISQAHTKSRVLNQTMEWKAPPQQALSSSVFLLQTIVPLIWNYTKDHGTSIDYDELIATQEWTIFLQQVCELRVVKVPSDMMERRAFFINLFNLLLLHAMVAKKGIPTVNLNRTAFMRRNRYEVAGQVLSLDEIYHGILRGNQRDWLLGARFSKSDVRASWVVELDARVHFSLLMMTETSPYLHIYNSTSQIDSDLNTQVRAFVDDTTEFTSSAVTVHPIFSWFKADFGKKSKGSGIASFVAKHNSWQQAYRNKVLNASDLQFAKHYSVPSFLPLQARVAKPMPTILEQEAVSLLNKTKSTSSKAWSLIKSEIMKNVARKK